MQRTKNLDLLRVVKAMQTQALRNKLELRALASTFAADSDYDNLENPHEGCYQQTRDAEETIQNHIDALQHIVDQLLPMVEKRRADGAPHA